jgi:HTH-type transcriptional regulator / antitoxin HipB
MPTQNIYSTLLEARRAKGLTQAQLGNILSLPQSYISQVENGRHDIKMSTLTSWVRVLDLELMPVPRDQISSVSYLLQSNKAMKQQEPPPAYGPLPDNVE